LKKKCHKTQPDWDKFSKKTFNKYLKKEDMLEKSEEKDFLSELSSNPIDMPTISLKRCLRKDFLLNLPRKIL